MEESSIPHQRRSRHPQKGEDASVMHVTILFRQEAGYTWIDKHAVLRSQHPSTLHFSPDASTMTPVHLDRHARCGGCSQVLVTG